MPKRYPDASPTMSGDRVQRKTERSHEENQERAYIAASRRADRSIEARVQSARMASEIHKRRTGKGFKISEEIVMKEEMYEEEDDDLPRGYRALAAQMQQSSSAEINERFSHYINNEFALNKLARMREIDRQFAEMFPNASRVAQNFHVSNSGDLLGLQQQAHPQQQQQQQQQQQPQQQHEPPNRGYSHSPMLDYSAQFARERSHSISQASPVPDLATRRHTIAAVSHHMQSSGSGDESGSSSLSPPALTPGSGSSSGSTSGNNPDTPIANQLGPSFSTACQYASIPTTATSIDETRGLILSAIPAPYTEYPAVFQTDGEREQGGLMANSWAISTVFRDPETYREEVDMETAVAAPFGAYEQLSAASGMRPAVKARQYQQQPAIPVTSAAATEDYFHQSSLATPSALRFDGTTGQRSTVGTPGGGPGGDNFDVFFDMEQYAAAAAAVAWNETHQG